MTINIWKDFTSKGFVFAVYTFLRTLNAITALVLCQIISEFNQAYNNKLNYYDDFLCSSKRMMSYLGLTPQELNKALNELQKYGFIEIFDSKIQDTLYIRVNQDKIINFKKEQENKNYYGNWDDCLKRSQNPINKVQNFSEATVEIKKFIEERTKNPETIPLILYSVFDDVAKLFQEKCGCNVLTMPNLKEYINDLVKKEGFSKEDFENFINDVNELCTEGVHNNYFDEIPMEDDDINLEKE